MKKLFLLLTVGSIGFAATAQSVSHANRVLPSTKKVAATNLVEAKKARKHSAARTTATTPFYTQDFAGNLPAGWSVGTTTGVGTWHHAYTASASAFPTPAIMSTTAANGWMVFDSDSLGAACGTCMPAGYMQTAALNCTGHPTVRLSFQEMFHKYNDSCFVWVSTSSSFAAGTYTSYPITVNNSLITNAATTNPRTINVNITSVAAGSATVYIRFVYKTLAAGGSYSWQVDDMTLSELDPHDVRIDGSFLFNGIAAYNSSIFTTPLKFVDSVAPITRLTNEGAGNENVSLGAQILNGSSSVYTQTMTVNPFATGFQDSLIEFPAFMPTSVGNYTLQFGANITGDADVTNNVDTVKFAVTDTLWMQNQGAFTSAYAVHRNAATGGVTALSSMFGARFDVPPTATIDTISGFGVAFASSSAPTGTGKVAVQLYSIKDGDDHWSYLSTSVARSIVAGDISAAGVNVNTATWAYFPIDFSSAAGGLAPFIVDTNTTYAAVLQINGVTTNLSVLASGAPNATSFSGYFGQSDTSLNDGAISAFGADIRTGLSDVPAVRMYFGNVNTTVGVSNVNATAIATTATPNPASTEVKVSFTQATAADAIVNLTNTVGQVVATQSVKSATNGVATFNTASLPAGIYFYSVIANGARSTGRVVVAH